MYKVKRFSIQSGAPSKPGSLSRELTNRAAAGAGIGLISGSVGSVVGTSLGYVKNLIEGHVPSAKDALIVAGIFTAGSAAFGAIAGALSALGANGRRAKATKTTMSHVLDTLDVIMRNYEKNTNDVDINIFRYIDTDQNVSNYQVSMAFEDGCAVILLKNPKADVLAELNESLEDMIKYNRKADYVAEKVDDGYVVYATIPSVDFICSLIHSLIYNCRVKINCLTEKKIQL